MIGSLLYVFNPSNFKAHGLDFVNTPVLFWGFVIANLITFIAYIGIPILLVYFISKRRDMIFQPTFIFFALFIVLCGIHHLLHTITFFYPIYGIEMVNDIAMAAVSIGTFFSLFSVLKKAIKLMSPEQYKKINEELFLEVEKRKKSEEELKKNQEILKQNLGVLSAKNVQLQKLNDLMTERELKMIELKKEIEDLKKK